MPTPQSAIRSAKHTGTAIIYIIIKNSKLDKIIKYFERIITCGYLNY